MDLDSRLTLWKVCRMCSVSYFCLWGFSLPRIACWRDCHLSRDVFWLIYQRLVGCRHVDWIGGFCSVHWSIWSMCHYKTMIVTSCSMIGNLVLWCLWLCFCCLIALAIQGLLCFNKIFTSFFLDLENIFGILIGITLDLWFILDSIDILIILILPSHEHGSFVHFLWLLLVSLTFCNFYCRDLSLT